jgi:hypothetical protein
MEYDPIAVFENVIRKLPTIEDINDELHIIKRYNAEDAWLRGIILENIEGQAREHVKRIVKLLNLKQIKDVKFVLAEKDIRGGYSFLGAFNERAKADKNRKWAAAKEEAREKALQSNWNIKPDRNKRALMKLGKLSKDEWEYTQEEVWGAFQAKATEAFMTRRGGTNEPAANDFAHHLLWIAASFRLVDSYFEDISAKYKNPFSGLVELWKMGFCVVGPREGNFVLYYKGRGETSSE